jgi:WD40 repeat protein
MKKMKQVFLVALCFFGIMHNLQAGRRSSIQLSSELYEKLLSGEQDGAGQSSEGVLVMNDAELAIFSPDGMYLAAAFKDNVVRVLSIESKQCIQKLVHKGLVKSLAWSADGRVLATVEIPNILHVWSLEPGAEPKKPLCSLEHNEPVYGVALSSDGAMVTSASYDKMVRIWRVETGECVCVLEGHQSWVNAVAFSADDLFVVSGSDDNTLRIWNVATQECARELRGHTGLVTSVAFSPYGLFVASASWDHTVRIWRVETGACVRVLKKHNADVLLALFSPDGNDVVSASFDRTVCIWNAHTGELKQTLPSQSNVTSLAFGPYGEAMVAFLENKAMRIWVKKGSRWVLAGADALEEESAAGGLVGSSSFASTEEVPGVEYSLLREDEEA